MEKKDNNIKKPEENVKQVEDRDPKRFNDKRKRKMRMQKPTPENERVILSIRRVVRVVAGGRRFSQSVAIAMGNKKGRIGIGVGNGPDLAIAIDKAAAQATKNMVNINITDDASIPHVVSAKYCSSEVTLRPGAGFVAGGAVRKVAILLGLRNVNAKIISRSKNPINNARATISALQKCRK